MSNSQDRSADPLRLKIQAAASELTGLLPHYQATNPKDERSLYFRGLMAKAADSLIAIDSLIGCARPVWPGHCRWIIEALGFASALQNDRTFLEQIKRDSVNTYLVIAGMEDAERAKILASISATKLPTIESLLKRLEESLGAGVGLLYKYYRFLCEYAHFESSRTIAYPSLGVESPQDLNRTKNMFLNLSVAAALSLPVFAHCPPDCGFGNDYFEKITILSREAWRTIAES